MHVVLCLDISYNTYGIFEIVKWVHPIVIYSVIQSKTMSSLKLFINV